MTALIDNGRYEYHTYNHKIGGFHVLCIIVVFVSQ